MTSTATLNVDTGDGSIALDGTADGRSRAVGRWQRRRSRRSPGSAPEADWDITTGDGSVTLAVPDGFGAELDAHTGDGGIRMEEITLSNVTGKIGRNTVRGRLGAGGRGTCASAPATGRSRSGGF